jgi:hypothetical protein
MIFSFGAPRSGTFWLQRIVSAHPAVAAVPSETDLFSLGIGPLFHRFHHGLRSSTTVGQTYVDRDVLLDATRDFCDRILVGHLTPGVRYLAERSPMHVHSVDVISAVYPDARLIHIIRDGRDVARSVIAREWGADSIAVAAAEWRDAVRAARENAPPDRYHEVRYEDVLADPRSAIAQLYTWLELDFGDADMDRALAEARIQRNHDPTDPRPQHGKWRDHFSPEDLHVFEDVAGDLLDELGYDRAAGDAAGPAPAEPAQPPPPAAAAPPAQGDGPSLSRAVLRRLGLTRGARRAPQANGSPQRRGEAMGGAMARVQGVVDELLGLIQAGRLDDAGKLLLDDAKVTVTGPDGEVVAYGPAALADALRADPAWGGRQVRGDMLPGIPTYSVVLTYELDGGSRVDRMLALVVVEGRVKALSVYQPPL